MQRFHDLVGKEVTWRPRHLRMTAEHEMQAGQALVAELRFLSSFGSLAVGECADGIWTFKRVGFLRPSVTVRVNGSEADLAVFRSRDKTIEAADGGRFAVKTNAWSSRLELKDAAGDVLIRFKIGFGFAVASRTVMIEPAAAGLPDLPQLTLLAWYLFVGMQSDGGSGTAAGAAAGLAAGMAG